MARDSLFRTVLERGPRPGATSTNAGRRFARPSHICGGTYQTPYPLPGSEVRQVSRLTVEGSRVAQASPVGCCTWQL
jgi:hypothetical protein